MVRCNSSSILWVTVSSLCAIALMCAGGHRDRVLRRPQDHMPIKPIQGTQRHSPSPMRYGKMKLPVDISIDLAQAENTGSPVTIVTTVSTEIPIRSGILTLKIPQIDAEPERTDPLWSAAEPGVVAETAEYGLGILPLGRYQVIAFFEFTLDREGAEKSVLSRSLYVDVRPDVTLSSNVSFRHIDRLALQRDLDERIFTSLERELKTQNRTRVLRELALLEVGDPATMRRKIRELRASDPDAARRMMALNRVKSEPMNETGSRRAYQALAADSDGESIQLPLVTHRGPPAFEQAVPIPERLKR
jgi:hypothetical protein